MLRTNTFYQPNLNALTSSGSIEDTPRSVTGVRRQKPHQWSGNGTHQARSGIDGMITNGTTGDHPREDSPPSDGPGIRDSGITTVGYSSTPAHTGTDSKVESGSDMADKSQSSQRFQLAQRFADHSSCLRNGDSQLLSESRLSQDAKSELVEWPLGTCSELQSQSGT